MLSLCMITKNEEQLLARCLNSIRAMVDEIIVVDTGSIDNTREIAKAFGAKIYKFKWNDDFAAARNYCLSKACGDWIFSLDADEAIAIRDHQQIVNLTLQETVSPRAYAFITRNYTNEFNLVGWTVNDGKYKCEEAGRGWVPTKKVRLFPSSKHIYYDYAVHEMVEPSLNRMGIKITDCHIPIHHYGPLLKNNGNLKMLAYYQMGKNKLSQHCQDVAALRELAIQAAILGKTNEAADLWEKFIILKPNTPEAFVHLGTCYFELNNYEAALMASQQALILAPAMLEAIYNYALCEFVIGDSNKTIAALENGQESLSHFLPAKFVLAAAHICSGNRKKGIRILKELRRTEMGPNLNATCKDLTQRLIGQNRKDYAQALIETVISKNEK